MQSKDIIRLFGHSLFVQFGNTGEHRYVNTLNLQKGLTLMKDGYSVQACYHDFPSHVTIDVFGSEALADRAFGRMQIMLHRYARYRRFATFSKSIVKWVVTPIGVLMLALALNAAATRSPLASLPGSLGNPALSSPTTLGAVNASPSLVGPPPVEIAKAMADGVNAGKFSVPLSKSGKDSVYVFSDPSCPHCQDVEPALDKLAKHYTVHIFPVSVIGGQISSQKTATLLCAKPDDRAALWKKVIAGNDAGGQACDDGVKAMAANDQIFRAMRFAGTPTILASTGQQLPDSAPMTAEAIGQWLQGSVAVRR